MLGTILLVLLILLLVGSASWGTAAAGATAHPDCSDWS